MVVISEIVREDIVHMILSGLSQREVGRRLNIGHTTVRKIWLKFKTNNSTKNVTKIGRPVVTSQSERRRICQISRCNPFMTPQNLKNCTHLNKNIIRIWFL